ncbi:MAG TPA: MFS transporter [Solirubrobacteraceae bacterium]|nr:MFS transporter [Solirubrobacteraceae bacterium]
MSSAAPAAPVASRGLQIRPLIGGCLVGLAISWNIANVGPVATLMAHHYGTTLTVVGLFTTVLFFAELAVMVPGGRAIDRHGAKRIGLVAIALSLIANLALMVPTSPVPALVLRGVAGLGVGLGFLSGAIYVQSGAGQAQALASGIYGGVSLGGGGLALAIVPQLVSPLGWRAPYASAAVVAAVTIPLVLAAPPTPGHGGSAEGPRLAALMADRQLLRLGVISTVSFGFSVILGNWVVTLLERHGGLHAGPAGAIGSLILLMGIVGRPAGGILVRAHPHLARPMLAASFLAGSVGTVVLFLAPGSAGDAAAAALIGLAAGIPFGFTIAGATRARPHAAGAAVGAMNTYPVLAIVCGAPLVGLTFSLTGRGRIGFAVVAALWSSAILVLKGLDI